VLVSRLGFEITIRIKEYFESKDVHFDAVYHHKDRIAYSNYNQIYEDFQTYPGEIETNIIVVAPLPVANDDYDNIKADLTPSGVQKHISTSLLYESN
jgi:hypothetical protein